MGQDEHAGCSAAGCSALWAEPLAAIAAAGRGPSARAERDARQRADTIVLGADLAEAARRLVTLFAEAGEVLRSPQATRRAIERYACLTHCSCATSRSAGAFLTRRLAVAAPRVFARTGTKGAGSRCSASTGGSGWCRQSTSNGSGECGVGAHAGASVLWPLHLGCRASKAR